MVEKPVWGLYLLFYLKFVIDFLSEKEWPEKVSSKGWSLNISNFFLLEIFSSKTTDSFSFSLLKREADYPELRTVLAESSS